MKHLRAAGPGFHTSFVLVALLVVRAGSAFAEQGDCSQPVSNGTKPVTSDCLFVLRAAVGSATCIPNCMCDLNASGGAATASDALACLNTAVGATGLLNCPCTPVGADGDDFDDSAKDPTKWGTDEPTGNGHLSEEADRLQYTCSSGTDYDESYRPWIKSVLPYNADWEAQIDVRNSTDPEDGDVSSVGIEIRGPNDDGDYLYTELYAARPSGTENTGFYAELGFNQGDYAFVDTNDLNVTSGAVRAAFDASTKVITVYWDYTGGEYTWNEYGSFGIDGNGGDDGNANWGVTSGQTLSLRLYGYSANMVVEYGRVYSDNFYVTGAVPP